MPCIIGIIAWIICGLVADRLCGFNDNINFCASSTFTRGIGKICIIILWPLFALITLLLWIPDL